VYGFHLGIKIGPGEIFYEYRVGSDIIAARANVPGVGRITLFSEQNQVFFFGYEIGVINRR
jgi:hypothetical protein